jgi:hypothetical protein
MLCKKPTQHFGSRRNDHRESVRLGFHRFKQNNVVRP